MRAFTSDEMRDIEAAQRRREALACPSCGVPLDVRPVPPPATVSYVRRRIVVSCPECHGHGAIDRD